MEHYGGKKQQVGNVLLEFQADFRNGNETNTERVRANAENLSDRYGNYRRAFIYRPIDFLRCQIHKIS